MAGMKKLVPSSRSNSIITAPTKTPRPPDTAKLRRFCVITPEYLPAPGGVAGYIAQMVRGLAREGDEVEVYSPEPAVEDTAGVRVHALAQGFDGNARRDVERDLARHPGTIVLLQYVPGAIGGVNPSFVRWVTALDAPVFAISARTSAGVDALARRELVPGETIALVGSSGVGKSTLTNVLLGRDERETTPIREWDGKGRHTTTTRELTRIPSGAWLTGLFVAMLATRSTYVRRHVVEALNFQLSLLIVVVLTFGIAAVLYAVVWVVALTGAVVALVGQDVRYPLILRSFK